MKTIVIKTQAELDALPKSFEEYTIIEIRAARDSWLHVVAHGNSHVEAYDSSHVGAWDNSHVVARGNSRVEARGNSSVVAWDNSRVVAWDNSHVVAWGNSRVEARGNSRVVAWDNSRVVAWDNSHVEAYEWSYVLVLSAFVIIKKLLDNTTAVFRGCRVSIEEKSDTAHAREVSSRLDISFEEWLRRGYVYADGIRKKLVSQQTQGEITVFEVEEFLERTNSFVAKKGDSFAHGKTKDEALVDLEFKIGGRDTSQYNSWKLDEQKPLLEMTLCYRRITGACRQGIDEFLKQLRDKKETYSPREVIALTKGHFGHEEFEEFGWDETQKE